MLKLTSRSTILLVQGFLGAEVDGMAVKVPASPPPTSGIIDKLAREDNARLLEILANAADLPDGDYLPWDKLRFKTPPPGLTNEEWWLGIKIARNSSRRRLNLTATDGTPFFYTLPDDLLRMTEEISRRASGVIAVPEQVTNPATRDRYVVNSLIEEAIRSSQLEGASTSRKVAKEMIRSGRRPENRSERMILNNYNAMRRIGELRDEDLSPELICELHRIVTDGTLDDPKAAGRIQSNPDPGDRVAVWGWSGGDEHPVHTPPPVDQLEERLARLCSFANSLDKKPWIQPVLRSLIIHFMMGYDHYFEDGNGRTARILFYWSMLRHGYWLTEFLSISHILAGAPAQYGRSFLYTELDEGDLTYFFLYQLKVIVRSINELDKYLARKVEELRETRVLLSATPGEYNYRQLALLELAIKDPNFVFTIDSHARSHRVSYETARSDLRDLQSRSLLRQSKSGRQFVWLPAQDLPSIIRQSQFAHGPA
jgi:Fic family protein